MPQQPDNPYQPTGASARAQDVGTVARPFRLAVTATLNAVASIAATISAPHVMRDFRELFGGFGADIPPLTHFFIHAPWIWALFALSGAYICARIWLQPDMTRSKCSKWQMAVRLHSIAFGLTLGLAVYALYSPIFMLGRVV